jgi:hypothetical protein
MDADRDRGTPRDVAPPTPPGIRVRTTAVRPVEQSRFLEIGQPERIEVGAGERPAERRRQGGSPRPAIAACGEEGIPGVDATLPQLTETCAGSCPLFPNDGTKPPPNPFVKTSENRWRLAEAEIRPPSEHVRSEFLDHLAQAHAAHASGQRPDSCSKPDQRLVGETPLRSLAMGKAEAQKRPLPSRRHRTFRRVDFEFQPRRDEERDARHHTMSRSGAANVHITVVCISHETMTTAFELAIQRMQYDVRQAG